MIIIIIIIINNNNNNNIKRKNKNKNQDNCNNMFQIKDGQFNNYLYRQKVKILQIYK